MKQSSPNPNKNLLMLKNYVDQGFFSKRNRVISEWSDSGLRYYKTCKYANKLMSLQMCIKRTDQFLAAFDINN